MQGLELLQLGLLIFSLLSIAAILADHRHFTLSGITLALATIKPQMAILPIAWMLLWAISGWAERKGLDNRTDFHNGSSGWGGRGSSARMDR